MIRVLLVDDEKTFRDFLEKKLTKEDYQVTAVGSGKEAVDKIGKEEFDVAILDIALPDISGMEVLEKIQKQQQGTESIMLTGYASIESAIEAMKRGAYDYLEKPAKTSEIKVIIEKAYEKCRMNREIENIKEERKRSSQMYKMVGQSKIMEDLQEMIGKVARASSSVLIEGESGTGKELIAREIHRRSPRSEAPFISIDCGALQENLMENELFGHSKGAYTGAATKQIGLLELADTGTLFIDEVGELEVGMQKKFLRFLETGEFRRLGESKLRRVDVRVIAATNRILKKAVEEGRFREDLYYRLDVVKIQAPPLRERKSDIPLLVDHFLKMHRSGPGTAREISDEVLELFQEYDWPGNIRELKNVIERAVILSTKEEITLEDIPRMSKREKSPSESETDEMDLDSLPSLTEMEKRHIRRALELSGGNKTQAAQALGIGLRSLYRKLDKYEIEV